MNKRKSFLSKSGGMVLALLLAFSFCVPNVSAANVGWTLKCDPKLNYYYNKISTDLTVTTTKKTTTIHVNNVGGGAEVFLYSTNGISALKKGKGGDYVSTKKGKNVYMSVHYNNYGTSISNPSGYYDY